jgi:hypothetical protein
VNVHLADFEEPGDKDVLSKLSANMKQGESTCRTGGCSASSKRMNSVPFSRILVQRHIAHAIRWHIALGCWSCANMMHPQPARGRHMTFPIFPFPLSSPFQAKRHQQRTSLLDRSSFAQGPLLE